LQKEKAMKAIKTILHATDFSECSQPALDLAASLARDNGAKLLILHVVPSTAPVVGPGNAGELKRAETQQQELVTYQDEMMNRLRQIQVPSLKNPVEHLLKQGDVAKTILQTADERACDLIVIGTHGKSGYAKILMGSVAEAVSRGGRCLVVTVKAPG
jgi:universal stress protein A